jgi:hypothetical protein
MGEMVNACKALIGKPEKRRRCGRPRRWWEDTFSTDREELGRGLDETLAGFGLRKRRVNFLTSWATISCLTLRFVELEALMFIFLPGEYQWAWKDYTVVFRIHYCWKLNKIVIRNCFGEYDNCGVTEGTEMAPRAVPCEFPVSKCCLLDLYNEKIVCNDDWSGAGTMQRSSSPLPPRPLNNFLWYWVSGPS